MKRWEWLAVGMLLGIGAGVLAASLMWSDVGRYEQIESAGVLDTATGTIYRFEGEGEARVLREYLRIEGR